MWNESRQSDLATIIQTDANSQFSAMATRKGVTSEVELTCHNLRNEVYFNYAIFFFIAIELKKLIKTTVLI